MNCPDTLCLAGGGRCAPPIRHLLFTIHNSLVSRLGLEPRTPALKGQCSTIELPAHIGWAQARPFSQPALDGQYPASPASFRTTEQGSRKLRGMAFSILTTYTSGTSPVNTNRSPQSCSLVTFLEILPRVRYSV